MKRILLVLIAGLLGVPVVTGQSSPAANDSNTAEAASGSLTPEERRRAVEYLTETQNGFLTAIDGLSEEQWKFKAAPDRWSIAETAEHIALTEDLIWDRVTGKIMPSAAAPEKRAKVRGKEEMILKVIPDRSRKATAPEQLNPTGKWPTRAELVKNFVATREREIAYLQETKKDLRSHFDEHPFLKTMDAWQWLLLNGAHGKRHTAQILEVKADPNFPKS